VGFIRAHNTTRLLTSTYANEFDTSGTLSSLKPFRGLATTACRLVGAVVLASGILLSSAANAYAPRLGFEKINELKAYAKLQLNAKQYLCLDKLYTYESHWNPKATNGTHWGIPQGESIWLRNKSGYTQIDWGLRYIKHRYSTPCKALYHFNTKGWH
jgi:hypothetical protein